ncbi:MAG: cellulase family glycosylhydrolase, partial [Bryobacteraceae bacterium]
VALRGFDVSWVGEAGLSDLSRIDLLITPYGSAFPIAAWEQILGYLHRGGNWVNLGGVPFSVPVVRESGAWRQEIRQTEYHKTLGITSAFAVTGARVGSWREGTVAPDSFLAETVYELYIRLTSTHEFADEIGSAGMRETSIRALTYGLDARGVRIAAPFVQIDRLEGPFAGGRWVLANLRGSLTSDAIRVLVTAASEGASEFEIRPSFACYYGDERPFFTVLLKGRRSEKQCEIEVRNEAGTVIAKVSTDSAEAQMPANSPPLAPGFYRVEARMGTLQAATGFLVVSAPGIPGGIPFTCNRDYLLRDGVPFVVTGTTYMAADAQREFLLEPNPAVWDRDFAEMKRSGVNMVRTGIWTGWKQIMPEIGRVEEGCLRALDAFLAVARRHDIAVIFNLFAFFPEMWGGRNPYLDPRSVQAQKEFVFQLADRCRGVNDLTWDLINEPAFCSPAHPFNCRPNYDEYERAAWRSWLKSRYPDETKLREMWGLTPLDSIDLPALEDFFDQNIFDKTHPLPVLEYHLFAQDMFNQWVREISSAIRANGNRHQLITVGQDEGGLSNQPSPLFHDQVVDFTCVHNWWLNDDLLWDSLLTKSPMKPNLVEESGIMFYETMRRTPGRTEEQARDLLERKMAFAMGANGAGFIQWLWNTNAYIPDDNEASIGFFRADGTAKPELQPFRAMASFWREHGSLLMDKQLEDVVMVVPQSHLFSVRDFASLATKRAVRVMHYECLTPMRVAGEYALEREFIPGQLIVLPSPQIFTNVAWNVLMSAVRNGSTLLVTGMIDRDEHWIPVDRSRELGLRAAIAPIAQEEALRIEGVDMQAGFHDDTFQRIEKEIVDEEEGVGVHAVSLGKGKVLWCPLPLETSSDTAPVAALYRYALKQAGVRAVYLVDHADPSVLIRPSVFARSVLYTLINESGQHKQVDLAHLENRARISVPLPPQRAAHVIVDRSSGQIAGKLLPAGL